MTLDEAELVDRAALAKAKVELGADFARILGYFREDGAKSLAAIERAMRARDAAALVLPAHTLKGEAAQFGASPLAALAETIEDYARDCVERHDTPDDALTDVVALRPLLDATMTVLDREAAPPVAVRRPGGFGRRVA